MCWRPVLHLERRASGALLVYYLRYLDLLWVLCTTRAKPPVLSTVHAAVLKMPALFISSSEARRFIALSCLPVALEGTNGARQPLPLGERALHLSRRAFMRDPVVHCIYNWE